MNHKKLDPSAKVLSANQKWVPGPLDKVNNASAKRIKIYMDKLGNVNNELKTTREQLETAMQQLESVSLLLKGKQDQLKQISKLNSPEPEESNASNLAMILDNTDECFVLLGKDLRIRTYNSAAQKQAEFFIGRPFRIGDYILDHVLPERKAILEALYAEILSGNTRTYEQDLDRTGTSPAIFCLTYKPIRDTNGDVCAIMINAKDISCEKEIEKRQEFERSNRDALMNTTVDLIWSVDKDLCLITANRAVIATSIYQTGVELKPGDNVVSKDVFPEDQLQIWKKMYEKALEEKGLRSELHLPPSKFYEEAWLDIRMNPIMDGNEMVGLACYAHDITATKKHEKNLLHINKKLETAQQIAKLGYWEMGLDQENMYWSSELYKIWGVKPETFKPTFKSFFETVHPDDRDRLISQQQEAIVGSRILNIEFRIIVEECTIKYIHLKGSLTTDIVTNEQRFEGTVQDITARRQIEETLRINKERYDIVSKATNDAIWDWDLVTGKIYRAKEGLKKVYGYDENEPIENIERWAERIHPDDKEAVNELLGHVVRPHDESTFSAEYRFLQPCGKYVYVLDRGYVLRDENGKAIRLIGAAQDITTRKNSEQRVADSERRYRTIFEQNLSGIYRTTLDGRITNCNQAFAEMLGYQSPEEIMKISTRDMHVSPESHDNGIVALIEKRKLNNFEVTLKKKDGTQLHTLNNVTLVTDSITGIDYCEGVMLDVTRNKEAEILLLNSEKRFRALIENSTDGITIIDAQRKVLDISPSALRILGYTREEYVGGDRSTLIHPDDREMVNASLQEVLKNPDSANNIEYRFKKADGNYTWIESSFHNQLNEPAVNAIVINFRDISQRKQAEEILKHSEERYRQLFNNNPAVIIVWDITDFKILEVNDTAIAQYDYTREELLSMNMLDLKLPDEYGQLRKFAQRALNTPDFKEVRTQKHLTRSGEVLYMNITAQKIGYKGKAAVLAIAKNVTEKIQLKAKLDEERMIKQQEITAAVITAQENERQQLGIELHDNVNQILASSRLYLGMVKRQEKSSHPFISESENLILSAINEIRNLSHSLIPPSLSDSELINALENIVAVTRKSGAVNIDTDWSGFSETSISDKLKLSIYRIVQEQFNNIYKYAKASNINVSLSQKDEQLILRIKDDGIGFDTSRQSSGVGLMNIKTRAALSHGELSIKSSPGNGCELTVFFRINNQQELNDAIAYEAGDSFN